MGAALTDAEVGLGTGALSDADVGLSPSSAVLSDADVGLVAPTGKRAQPGSLSFIAQGVPAAFESLFRMGMGMAGTSAGALVGGVEAIPELVQGQGQAAADIVRGRMQTGAEQMTPEKTRFAPTSMFDEYLAKLFEGIRAHMGETAEIAETARGTVARKIAPKAMEPLVKERPEAARTLGEAAFDVPAAIAPAALALRGVRPRPKPVQGAPESTAAMQPAFIEGEIGPPPTGTSSGVPLPLDKLIAQAQYLGRGEIPQPPKPRQLVREAAEEGLEARAPRLPAAEFAPEGAPARPVPGGELPEPPVGQAPSQPAARPAARDFFLEESPIKLDVPRSEVRGGEAFSGGEGRRVFETVHFREPFELLLANAGRDWAKPENKAAALKELKDVADQLPAESPFAPLRGASYDRLELAAAQYWREARTELLTERRRNPTADRVQVEAPPAERVVVLGEEPPPPRGLPPLPEPSKPFGEFGMPPAARGEPLELKGQTEAQIRADEATTRARAAEQARREAAPPPEEFTMTGSERAADVGAAAGQMELEGRPSAAPRAKKPAAPTGLLYTIKQMGGIKPGEAPDIGGERGFRASEGAGRGLFRKEGLGMDDLATQLQAKGYRIDVNDVDGGVQQLRDMIRDELEGKQKHYPGQSEEAAFEAMAAKRRGPSEFSANPMFDPIQIKESVKFFGEVGGKLTDQGRKWVNAVQATPESAKPALATMWRYANEVAYARERAMQDRIVKKHTAQSIADIKAEYQEAVAEARKANPKYVVEPVKTVQDAIKATEFARREAAKWRMQRALYDGGFAVKATEGEAWKEFRQPSLNIRDLRGPDGRLMKLRNDALPLIEQMAGAHDIARQRRYQGTLLGAAEGVSHGVVSWLMWNPFFHGTTTAGKGFIYSLPGRERASIFSYGKQAVESLSDRAQLKDMMDHGARFFPKRAAMEPLGGEAGRVEKGMKALGIERPYEFYQWVHGNLLANIVNGVQAAFYRMRLDQQVAQAKARGETVTPEKLDVFKGAAAEESNLIGGNLPRDQLAEGVYRALGASLFSRGLTTSTVRMLTRAFENNKIIEAYARSKGFTPEEARQIMTRNRNFMAASLLMDYMALQITANAVNWAMTEANQEPGGVEGGHFVWENQGSDKSQMWLPTNVFLYPETDDEDQPTGRGVYASSPMRVARDIVEWVEGIYQVATGQTPRILKNKLGVVPEMLLETIQGADWAGRPLAGPVDVATNIVGKVAPQPFGDVPWAAGESARTGNFGFTVEAIKKSFDPDTALPILMGAQPRVAPNDPTTIKFAVEQSKEERKLWGRVQRVKQMSRNIDPEVRERAIQDVVEEAQRIGMDANRIRQVARVMRSEMPSKAQARASQTYQRLHNEGEIPEPPQ